MKLDPEKVYGSVPETFSRRVEYALRRCEKEETKTMKRMPVAVIFVTILLLAMTTTAMAAVLSHTIEFFTFEYGERYRERLESGKVAPLDQSTTLNGAMFTLHDAVITPAKAEWLSGVGEVDPPVDTLDFYATGVIAPAEGENLVLLPWDEYSVDQPAGYAIYYPQWPKAPEDAPSYAELAKERSATIRKVSCIGWGILDGKGQLLPCTPGSSIIPLQDGTVHFSVEIPSESVVPWQDSYQLLLEVATVDVDLAGNEIDGTRQSADWIVTLVPEKAE